MTDDRGAAPVARARGSGRAAREEALRALLRAADPAAAARELSAVELARLRRATLDALRQRRRARATMPRRAVALAAAALVALALGTLVRAHHATAMRPERGAKRANASSGTFPAASPSPVALSTAQSASTLPTPPGAAAPAGTRPTASTRGRGSRRGRPSRPSPVGEGPRLASALPAATAAQGIAPSRDPLPFQIQLTTPGGTRIVWVLDPATRGR